MAKAEQLKRALGSAHALREQLRSSLTKAEETLSRLEEREVKRVGRSAEEHRRLRQKYPGI